MQIVAAARREHLLVRIARRVEEGDHVPVSHLEEEVHVLVGQAGRRVLVEDQGQLELEPQHLLPEPPGLCRVPAPVGRVVDVMKGRADGRQFHGGLLLRDTGNSRLVRRSS